MVGVVGSNPIVPTNSEKGRASDPFFMPCLSVRRLSESIRAPVFPVTSVRLDRLRAPANVRQVIRRVAFLAHPNPCGLW